MCKFTRRIVALLTGFSCRMNHLLGLGASVYIDMNLLLDFIP